MRFWSDNNRPNVTRFGFLYLFFAFTFLVFLLSVFAIFGKISFSCPPESLAPPRDLLQTPLLPPLVHLPQLPPLAPLHLENARPLDDVTPPWTFRINRTPLPRPGEPRDNVLQPPLKRLLLPPAVVPETAQLCPSPGESTITFGNVDKWLTWLIGPPLVLRRNLRGHRRLRHPDANPEGMGRYHKVW